MAQAAQDNDDEADQRVVVAHERRKRRKHHGDQHAAGGRQAHAQAEGHGGQPLCIDTHDADRVAVHDDGAQRAAQLRAVQEHRQSGDDRQRDDQRQQAHRGDQDGAELQEDRFDLVRQGAGIGIERQQHERAQHDGHAEHQQQRADLRIVRLGQPRDQHEVQQIAGQEERHERQRQRHQRVDPRVLQQIEREVRAQHQEFAVREVHHAQHAEDDVEPHSDQAVDGPQDQAVDQALDKQSGHGGILRRCSGAVAACV
ncbi:hypothetical protein D3C85_946660 [compost metagenome]